MSTIYEVIRKLAFEKNRTEFTTEDKHEAELLANKLNRDAKDRGNNPWIEEYIIEEISYE
jgi:hypothetical protein